MNGRRDGFRNENLYILPASGWVVASLPTFRLMRRLRRRNHERAEGWFIIKKICTITMSARGEYGFVKLMLGVAKWAYGSRIFIVSVPMRVRMGLHDTATGNLDSRNHDQTTTCFLFRTKTVRNPTTNYLVTVSARTNKGHHHHHQVK